MAEGVEVKGLGSLDEFIRRLAGLSLRLKLNVAKATNQISDHLTERGKANAPILTGDLISGLVPIKATISGNTVTGGVIDPVPYAWEMHQFQVPWGILYNLGPKTALKPPTEEGGPGGGYIRRVAVYHSRGTGGYLSVLNKAVKASLEGRSFETGESVL